MCSEQSSFARTVRPACSKRLAGAGRRPRRRTSRSWQMPTTVSQRTLPALVLVLAMVLAGLSGGCASMVSRATSDLADSLTGAILTHDDPQTVRLGAAAYLLMVDGLIQEDPSSPELLLAGSRLYASYTSAFVADAARSRRLSARARSYGLRALCEVEPALCEAASMPYAVLEQAVGGVERDHVAFLYGAAAAWATWVQARRDDWVAVADKARVELMMQRVVTLDEGHADGSAHLYLGVLDLLLPAALGGRPEEGRRHLERAVELSGGRDLSARVLLAREYARLLFDRELHDRLCREVLEAEPRQGRLTLGNMLARAEAQRLISAADEYFGTGSLEDAGAPAGAAEPEPEPEPGADAPGGGEQP